MLSIKKKCTTREWRVKFYLSDMRAAAQETTPQIALEKLFQSGRGEGQYICGFGKEGVHATKHIFKSFCWSHEASAGLMKLLLVMRNSCHHEGI